MQGSLGGGRLASSALGTCVHGEEAGAPAIQEASSAWASVWQAVERACDSAGSRTSSHPVLTVYLPCVHAGCVCALFSGPKGGRRITAAGQKDMDLIAGRVECSLPSYGL